MQRICRESLADGSVTHRRRQMVRIKHIKTMLEDLQRQIRSLRQSNNRSATNQNPDQESEEEELETAAQLGLDERNYDERVGEGHHMRNLARSGLTRALNRLNTHSDPTSQGPNSHRLSRAHSQLVSQMRAMFRATEMSPDLASRGKSPIAIAKAKASQMVMEKTKKTATVVVKGQSPSSNTKQELRALSQRLEKMLREQRESNPNDANEHWDHRYEGLNNLTRPEPLPIDPRKRWRHMYDGTLPPSNSTPAPSSSSASAIASILDGMDSSESGSESDLDLSIPAVTRGREFHRSPRFFQRRNSIRRWGPIEHQRSVSSRRFSPSRILRSRAVGQYFGVPVRSSNPLLNPESQDLNVDVEETAEDLGSDRLPPLREIIWRRHFRRRNVSLAR